MADLRAATAGRRLVLADLVPGAWARDAALVLAGAGLTGICAQISFSIEPLSPVPLTGQTFAVLLTGAALGTYRGLASMLLYVAAGIAGVPWFAQGESGFAKITMGYLIGFVIAAGVVGELARRGGDRTPIKAAGLMVLGNVIIYAFGVSWLMGATSLALWDSIYKGAVVFFVGDGIKIALAAGLLPGTWALVRRFQGEPAEAPAAKPAPAADADPPTDAEPS